MYVCLLLKFDFQKWLYYSALRSLFLSTFFYLIQVTFLKEEKNTQQKEVNKANQLKEIPEDQETVDLDDCQKSTPKPKIQLPRTDSQEWTPKYQTPQNELYSESSMNLATDEERYVCKIKSPNYTIYRDNGITVALQNIGDIPKELQDRLIRATVSNMVSTAYMTPFNRKPTKGKFMEMAKSLTVVYPCLSDPVNKHASEIIKLLRQSDFITNIHTFWPHISTLLFPLSFHTETK